MRSGFFKPLGAVASADITDATPTGRLILTAADVAAVKTLLAIAAADITNASANGRSLITAANYAAMKTLLAIVAADIADASANGRSLITAANYAAMKTLLAIAAADITDASANGRSLITAANYAAMKTLLAIAAADITDASANGRSLITAANYAAMNALLGTVVGPGAATDNAAVRFDATTGKLVQNSALIIDDTTGRISRSGNGGIPHQGTNTNDNAAAGDIGEVVSASVVQGSAISLTTGTPVNITSIPLTAGDWDVVGAVYFNPAGTTTITNMVGSISLVSATLDQAVGNYGQVSYNALVAAGVTQVPTINRRVTTAGATTAYLVTYSSFGTSTMTSFGKIEARRPR